MLYIRGIYTYYLPYLNKLLEEIATDVIKMIREYILFDLTANKFNIYRIYIKFKLY